MRLVPENMENMTGSIFNIQRYSTHDGPGIRTTVFLKGCPLRCYWCQNPESQERSPTLMENTSLCVGCGRCLFACPQEAISLIDFAGERRAHTDRRLCCGSGACVSACLQQARSIAGRCITLSEVMRELEKDRYIYRDSGGGVTVSGGDPIFQNAFALAILTACRAEGFDTAIETSGYTAWSKLCELVAQCDHVFYDLKHMDDAMHRQGTGVSNRTILENASLLPPNLDVTFRVPLIPGFNDSPENIRATRDFVKSIGRTASCIELLKYNNLGEGKFEKIGREAPHYTVQKEEHLQMLQAILRE